MDISEAIGWFEGLDWARWQSLRSSAPRTLVRCPFGEVHVYDWGDEARAEWTLAVFEPGLDAPPALETLVRDLLATPGWSTPVEWEDPFREAANDDAWRLHRWGSTDVYLAVRQEDEDVPFRVCLNRNLRAPD